MVPKCVWMSGGCTDFDVGLFLGLFIPCLFMICCCGSLFVLKDRGEKIVCLFLLSTRVARGMLLMYHFAGNLLASGCVWSLAMKRCNGTVIWMRVAGAGAMRLFDMRMHAVSMFCRSPKEGRSGVSRLDGFHASTYAST